MESALPSPKSHEYEVAFSDVLVKVTVLSLITKVKLGVGAGLVSSFLQDVIVNAPKMTTESKTGNNRFFIIIHFLSLKYVVYILFS
ncbi:hypothetical protein ES705_35179 [subsurface metagenome]